MDNKLTNKLNFICFQKKSEQLSVDGGGGDAGGPPRYNYLKCPQCFKMLRNMHNLRRHALSKHNMTADDLGHALKLSAETTAAAAATTMKTSGGAVVVVGGGGGGAVENQIHLPPAAKRQANHTNSVVTSQTK